MTSHPARTHIRIFPSLKHITLIATAISSLCASAQETEKNPRPVPQQQIDQIDPAELAITGDIDGKLVRLTVEAKFEVEQEDTWVTAAIGFDDFFLTDLQHSTLDVENGKARFEKTRLPVKSWRLFGKGQHKLKLSLIGAIVVNSNGKHRIQISAPKSIISNFLLRSPDPIESKSIVLLPQKPFRLRTNADKTSSEVQIWGLSGNSEIEWVPHPVVQDQTATVQHSGPATMKLDLATGTMAIKQPLAIAGGSISRLNVQLPAHFKQVLSIGGVDAEGRNIVKPITVGENNTAAIEFIAPVTGAITINYDLGLESTTYPQTISVQIPDLEEVANESADIEIFAPRGLELNRNRPDEKNTRRKRVEATEDTRAAMAYRLLSSDSKLDLTVSETEAFYSVAPVISLETEGETVLLTAYFSVNMVRGSLDEMEIEWPGFKNDGWKISDVTMGITGKEKSAIASIAAPNNKNVLSLDLSGRQAGPFEIELHATRPLQAFQTDDHLLFLPDIIGKNPHTTIVTLIESDSFSMSLRPQNEQSPFPSHSVSKLPEHLQEKHSRLSAWTIDSPDEAVDVQIMTQQSEVRSNVLAELSIADSNIHVHEVITYDVRHKDLSAVSLSIPSDARATVRLDGWNEQLKKLSTEPGEVSFALDEPRRGEFRIVVDYLWTPDIGPEFQPGTNVNIPIVLPAGSDQLDSIIVATNAPESLLVNKAKGWKQEFSRSFTAAWRSTQRSKTAPVTLRHPLRPQLNAKPQFLIVKTVAQGPTLLTSVTAVFDEPRPVVLFALDSNSTATEGYIDGQRVKDIDQVVDENPRTVQLRRTGIRQADNAAPFTATLIVRQDFTEQHTLFSKCIPNIPRLAGIDDNCSAIWVIAGDSQSTLVHSGHAMTELKPSIVQRLTEESASAPSRMTSAVSALVSPYSPSVANTVLNLLEAPLQSAESYTILSGPIHQSTRSLISIPYRTTLLCAAIFSALLYLLLLKLRITPLMTATALGSAAVVAASAVVPASGDILLSHFAPGALLALTAAMLQRFFSRRQSPAPAPKETTDQSTIFTIEKTIDGFGSNITELEQVSTSPGP